MKNMKNAANKACEINQFTSRSDMRMRSKFEKKGVEAGRKIWDITFKVK